MNKNILIIVITSVVALVSGYFLGTHFSINKKENNQLAEKQHKIKEIRESGYKLISPLLECNDLTPSTISSIQILENKINQYINEAKAENKVSHVSVYYRDLNNGPWFGIHEDEPYSPASLLKVPIMIAALKKAEKNKHFLKTQVKYTKHTTDETTPNILDSLIKPGKSYTIENLIYRMITFSDNEAKNLILENIENDVLNKTYSDLGIDIPGIRTPEDFMSVKDYSSYFRILYNATYLDKDMSEYALGVLTSCNYNSGLCAKLPSNVIVANKFGERGFEGSTTKQLHDCGIVYKTGNPYILCVMTRGNDFHEQANIIASISEIVYTSL